MVYPLLGLYIAVEAGIACAVIAAETAAVGTTVGVEAAAVTELSVTESLFSPGQKAVTGGAAGVGAKAGTVKAATAKGISTLKGAELSSAISKGKQIYSTVQDVKGLVEDIQALTTSPAQSVEN